MASTLVAMASTVVGMAHPSSDGLHPSLMNTAAKGDEVCWTVRLYLPNDVRLGGTNFMIRFESFLGVLLVGSKRVL